MADTAPEIAAISEDLAKLVSALLPALTEINADLTKLVTSSTKIIDLLTVIALGAVKSNTSGRSSIAKSIDDSISKLRSKVFPGIPFKPDDDDKKKDKGSVLGDIGKKLNTLFFGLINPIKDMENGFGRTTVWLGELITGIGGFNTSLKPIIASLNVVAEALVGVAAKAFALATTMVVASKAFVEAFSPGTVLLFNLAIRDLMATVGQGLQPILEVFTGTIRDIAAIINPLFKELAPLIRQFAEVIGGILIVVIQSLVEVIRAFEPVLKFIIDIFKVFAAVIKIFTAVITLIVAVLTPFLAILDALMPIIDLIVAAFGGLADIISAIALIFKSFVDGIIAIIKGLFGGVDTADTMKSLRDGIREVIKQLVIFSVTLAKKLGLDSVVDQLLKNFRPTSPSDVVAAATNPAIKSFENIANDLALAASVAQGGGGDKDADEKKWRADLLAAMEETAKNTTPGVIPRVATAVGNAYEWAADSYGGQALRYGRDRLRAFGHWLTD